MNPFPKDPTAVNELGKPELLEYSAMIYKTICENPEVDIIAHPLSLGRSREISLFSDIDPWLVDHIIEEAKRRGKILEVMSGMSWWFPKSDVNIFAQEYAEFIRKALDYGLKFSIGSDTHCVHGVGNISWSHKILGKLEPPE